MFHRVTDSCTTVLCRCTVAFCCIVWCTRVNCMLLMQGLQGRKMSAFIFRVGLTQPVPVGIQPQAGKIPGLIQLSPRNQLSNILLPLIFSNTSIISCNATMRFTFMFFCLFVLLGNLRKGLNQYYHSEIWFRHSWIQKTKFPLKPKAFPSTSTILYIQ